MIAEARLQRLWYGPAWLSVPLWPLGWLFGLGVAIRRGLYRIGVLPVRRVSVPVVVVGNVTVGGTGKTPVAAWIAQELGRRGHSVGVVLRGFGGRGSATPRVVHATDDPCEVGDEALLHARRGARVVAIGVDRVAAARVAEQHGATVIVCDDGLQHLRLGRDCEVAVVDAARGLGNGQLLPAGPLREPKGRLERVHAVLFTHRDGTAPAPRMALHGPYVADARFAVGPAVNLLSGERRELGAFAGSDIHAVAGIGHPGAFFAALRSAGVVAREHPLPDHAALREVSLPFPAQATVLMTEKDAVKCRAYAQPDWWYVELDVVVERDTARDLLALILERTGLTGAGVKLG
jgi:tetraacyldisaccharide 4'-kinase